TCSRILAERDSSILNGIREALPGSHREVNLEWTLCNLFGIVRLWTFSDLFSMISMSCAARMKMRKDSTPPVRWSIPHCVTDAVAEWVTHGISNPRSARDGAA